MAALLDMKTFHFSAMKSKIQQYTRAHLDYQIFYYLI